MKLRHIILFFIACFLLILSDLPGGSLLALAAWLQIYNLFVQTEFNRKTQIWTLLNFLCALPLVFFWGSIHSFLFIYLTEHAYLGALMALSIDYCLCLIATVYFLFTFDVAGTNNFQLLKSFTSAFDLIKTKKRTFFTNSSLFLIFSLIPILPAEWKIVFSVMATQLYLRRHQLKPVVSAGL